MRSNGSSVGFVFSVLYVASSIASHCVVVFGSLMSAHRVCFISFEPLRHRYCIGTGQTHRQTGRQEHTCTVYLVATFVFVSNGHFEKL